MISQEKLQEIRDNLEASQNPLFLFDNDVDGLCAFLILRRALGRGKGVAIKSFPDLKEQYLGKVDEFNSDAVFILDKSDISAEFVEGCVERNVLITMIDHHPTETSAEVLRKINYYNSLPSGEPTTYIAQSIFNRREDRWIAMIGCTGDVYTPNFAQEFEHESPELFNSSISAFEALHTTEIGKMVRMLNFGLMDSITNVVTLIKYLFTAKNAYDLLEENESTKQFHRRYAELFEFYKKQVSKAVEGMDEESSVIFFTYSGQISMSSEIANRLFFLYPDKLTVVAFKRPDKVNVSLRGKKALEITKQAVAGITDATGGGHKEATGARIPIDGFEVFKAKIFELVK